MTEKLQKVLARAGLGSRRAIEQWIAEGRLHINGALAHLGDRVKPEDKISLDGKPVEIKNAPPKRRVIALYKPEGVVCTRSDEKQRATIFDHLPRLRDSRWITVGRLDLNTSGLLLLTTDGELAHKLMHPSTGVEREYAVRVFGTVTPEILDRLKTGVMLEDGRAHFDEIIDAGGPGINRWFHVILKEGRQHEVRRLWESQGLQVSRLTRVRYGSITLRRGLKPGKWDELDDKDIAPLLQIAGIVDAPRENKKAEKRAAQKRREDRPIPEKKIRGKNALQQHVHGRSVPKKRTSRSSTPSLGKKDR